MSAACTLSSSSALAPAVAVAVVEESQARSAEVLSPASVPSAESRVRNDEPAPLLDAWSLAANEDGDACRAELKAAGFKFQALPDLGTPDKSGCGIPHGVVVFRGPTGIVYEPPVRIDCSLARTLTAVEAIVQDEGERHLRARIAKIGNLGGYACRPRNYRKGASLSAHAFGSAVDVASFHPVKGTTAVILRDWPESPAPNAARDDRRRFLRAVFGRLRHEAGLTYAVGPDFNEIHKNHFHLDRGGWHFWFHR